MSRRRAAARSLSVRIVRPLAMMAVVACVLYAGITRVSAHDGIDAQIAALAAQIAQQPSSADLLLRRADLYRANRQWPQAAADIDRAERLDPAVATPDLLRAQLSFDKGEWRASDGAASRFLARQPRHVEALLVRARARVHLRQTTGAVSDFTAALELRPQPDIYLERSRVLLGADRAGVETSLRSLDDGIARLGPIVTLELEAIDLELRLRHYDAALARLDRVSAQAARKESWLARRGDILERAGRLDEARASYRAALDAAQALPPGRRQSPASRALVQQVSADLERLQARTIPSDTRNR